MQNGFPRIAESSDLCICGWLDVTFQLICHPLPTWWCWQCVTNRLENSSIMQKTRWLQYLSPAWYKCVSMWCEPTSTSGNAVWCSSTLICLPNRPVRIVVMYERIDQKSPKYHWTKTIPSVKILRNLCVNTWFANEPPIRFSVALVFLLYSAAKRSTWWRFNLPGSGFDPCHYRSASLVALC